MIELIRSPWDKHFEFLVDQARLSLLISSPYIGKWPCKKIIDIKSKADACQQVGILLLTDLSPETLLSGATDVTAICEMIDVFPQLEVRFLPSIHAKVYVADDRMAVVTSANMTSGGLFNNFEYGIKLRDGGLVRKIRCDLSEYAALGTKVDRAQLTFLARTTSDLSRIRLKAEKSIRGHLRREFEKRLKNFEEEIIRLRAARRAPHAIYAETILYLLSRKPMPTAELHLLIQTIHPDLCDDNVDRVIEGKHFGKKWKHAVRTAQQHLKRTGQIELREGVWHLKSAAGSADLAHM